MNGGWEKMCNNSNDNTSPVPTSSAIVPYSLKSLQAAVAAATAVSVNDPTTTAAAAYMAASIHHHNPAAHLTQAALDHYRMQLYSYVSYADRLRYAHHHHHPGNPPGLALATSAHHHHHHPYAGPHALVPMSTGAGHAVTDVYALAASPYPKFDPCRAYRLHQEEPKPQHSYIGLIGMAILSSADKKLVLSDIYQYILDNYSYFRNRGPGWRNSIRHNLSLNDCFVKAGRSANGKGHFWAIHPANLEDFKKGDFRRRKAQRRVRKHLGLSVPEDDDSVSPPPPTPTATVSPPSHTTTLQQHELQQQQQSVQQSWSEKPDSTTTLTSSLPIVSIKKRRQFDMDSILAPERRNCCNCSEEMTGSVVCCNDVQCSNRGNGGAAALFGTIFKTGAGVIHGKAIASTTWVESSPSHHHHQQQQVELGGASHCKSRDDEDSSQERKTSDQLMMMMDECSSSSVVIEATPNWSVVSEEDEVDSRPNSRSSSNSSESCSNGSGYSVTLRRETGKGLSSSKGPKAAARDSPTQMKQRHANFLSARSTTTTRNAEPLLTAAAAAGGGGPLALIATGRPISHSNSVSATVVSESQT